MRDLQHLQSHHLAAVLVHEGDAAAELVEGDPASGLHEDILARAAGGEAIPEALPHQRIVRGEADRDPVRAVFVLGVGVRAVMHVHQPGPFGPFAQHAVGSDGEPCHREARGRVVDP